MNAMVSYNAVNDNVTWGSESNLSWDYWREWEVYPNWYQPDWSYPVYFDTLRYEDTYKKAFSIAKLLLKENLLVSRKLKDFIGLVEKIAKEL